MPRRSKTTTPEVQEPAIEEEDLDLMEESAGTGATSEPRVRAALPSFEDIHRGVAPFALGALLLVVGLGLMVAAFTQPYYELDLRQGPEPTGEGADESDRLVLRIYLQEWVRLDYDGGPETSPDRNAEGWEEAPIVGILMKRLAWTSYVGIGLIVLSGAAALLHRFGALTFPGPGPVLGAFAVVTLLTGLVPFMMEVAHHARIEWIAGDLDLRPAFFTSNADGEMVHDMVTRPLLGFWLHLLGLVALTAAVVMMFWDPLRAAVAGVARFAAVEDDPSS